LANPFQLQSQGTRGTTSQNLVRGRHGPVIYCEQHHGSQLSTENLYSNRKYWLNHDSAYVDNSAEYNLCIPYDNWRQQQKFIKYYSFWRENIRYT
jgi:hypothetical protein